MLHSADETDISSHIDTDGAGSRFTDGNHIGKIIVGKPTGLVRQIVQERDRGHTTANCEKAGFEEFQEKL